MDNNLRIIVDDTIDFRALFRVIRRGRDTFILMVAIGLIGGIGYLLTATPTYRAELTLFPTNQSEGSRIGDFQGAAAAFGIRLNNQPTLNIPDVIKSRRMQSLVLDQEWNAGTGEEKIRLESYWDLDNVSRFTLNPLKAFGLFSDPLPPDLMRLKIRSAALQIFSNRIDVKEETSGLIRISIIMEQPQLASDIANYLSQAVLVYLRDIRIINAMKQKLLIEKRLEEVAEELQTAENRLTDYRSGHRRISDSPDLQIELERHQREVEIRSAVYTTLQQQYELTKIEVIKDEPAIVVLDEAITPSHKHWPRGGFILSLGILSGLMAGLFIVLYRSASR